jgi:hypothetical protein
MSDNHDELDELEPLEPRDDPEAAPDAQPDPPAAVASPAPSGGPEGEPRKRQIGEKRELEEAPLKLRTAAKILLVGALFPFYSAVSYALEANGANFQRWDDDAGGFPWGLMLGAKVVAGVGCWLFHEGYQATHGGKHKSPVASFAKLHPMAVPVIASLFWLAAIVWLIVSNGPMYWFATEDGAVWTRMSNTGLVAEVLTMVLAGATISHIFGYEHGGKFNPIFPLMFLGPAIAGLLRLVGTAGVFSSDSSGIGSLGLAGSIVVAAGGIMAMKTMIDSMKAAKATGEERQKAIRAARKAERDAKRSTRAQEGGEG